MALIVTILQFVYLTIFKHTHVNSYNPMLIVKKTFSECGISNKKKLTTEVCLKIGFFLRVYDRIRVNFQKNRTYLPPNA